MGPICFYFFCLLFCLDICFVIDKTIFHRKDSILILVSSSMITFLVVCLTVSFVSESSTLSPTLGDLVPLFSLMFTWSINLVFLLECPIILLFGSCEYRGLLFNSAQIQQRKPRLLMICTYVKIYTIYNFPSFKTLVTFSLSTHLTFHTHIRGSWQSSCTRASTLLPYLQHSGFVMCL